MIELIITCITRKMNNQNDNSIDKLLRILQSCAHVIKVKITDFI
jgi:hypothetical protein